MGRTKSPRRIVIIGTGFGGIGLGIQLKRHGIDSFTILEKATSLGGTWRDNTYPGAACDVPSILYHFSFEPKTDWSRRWAPQSEIRDYMQECVRRNGLLSHIRFGAEVAEARFDEAAGSWTVRTTAGEEIRADVLVSAVGQLHHPAIPALPGLERFRGERFHSARWNHDYDLSGKRVAVIGNAASAIQLIPEVARQVRRLFVFQRSANWMIPRGDRPQTRREHWALTHVPGLRRFLRGLTWLTFELSLYPVVSGNRFFGERMRRASTAYMEELVADPALRTRLVPDYPIGGKRILITDGYYEALQRDNVELITAPIDHLSEDAVVTRDGTAHQVDAVILATGFRTNPFLSPMRIEGLGGRTLETEWADGAHAYYGLSVAGFPNFFMLYGPNTNLGHNSIIFMLEAQIGYVLQALRALDDGDLRYLDLRHEVMHAFNTQVQAKLARSAWAAAGASWYKDAAGRITNNWPWSTFRYWRRTRRLDLGDYRAVARGASAAARDDGAPAGVSAAGAGDARRSVA